jgi:endonuclease/exonuclease/phosphatase family metal-dependent hydrolase
MIRRVSATLIGLLIVGTVHAELPKEIRIVTYNIHYGKGADDKYDLERIAKIIAAEKPDIVALQAVDQETMRSGRIDQTAQLAKLTNLNGVFDHTIRLERGSFGNAVLTKLPIRSHKNIKLTSFANVSPDQAERRGVQAVELGDKDGPSLLLLCTVFDYRQDRDGTDERLNSAKIVNELVAKRGDELAILAGTMNAAQKNDSIRELAKHWRIAGVNSEGTAAQAEGLGEARRLRLLHTYPSQRPRYPLNYVMCRPAKRWEIVDVRTLNGGAASTHLPVLAVLRRIGK